MHKATWAWLVAVAAAVIAVVGMAAASAPAPAEASNQNSYIFPPNSHPYGKSYAQRGRMWWEWAASFPAASNPILDDGVVTAGDANDQPPGQVWYLAGTFGGSAERYLTVPSDKALFVPLWNFFPWSPEDCVTYGITDDPEEGCTSDQLHAAVDALMADPPAMTASLDDFEFNALTSYRARLAGAFTYTVEAGGLAADFGYPLGDRYPTISDGFYLMLKPLDEGEHTLQFSVEDFLDVTYHLTVE